MREWMKSSPIVFGIGMVAGLLVGVPFGMIWVTYQWVDLATLKDQWTFYGAVAGIGGGIFAVVIGAMLNASFNRQKERDQIDHERKALRLGIRAEVQSILEINRSQQVSGSLQIAMQKWESGVEWGFVATSAGLEASRERYFPVFSSTISRVGLLGDDAVGGVVRFYQMVYNSAIIINSLSRGELDILGNKTKAQAAKTALDLLNESDLIGQLLVDHL